MKSFLSYNQFKKMNYEGCISIFGAGIGAYYLAKDILRYHKRCIIECFIVSDKSKNIEGCFGIPVKVIDECTKEKDFPIIVGTLEWLQKEIVELLIKNSFQNIFMLKDEEYLNIRQMSPDSDADVLFTGHKALLQGQSIIEGINGINVSIAEINGRIAEINEKVAEIKRFLPREIVSYKKGNAFHDEYYVSDFEVLRKRTDFNNIIETLIKDLDADSRLEVYRIIHRLNLMCDEVEIPLTKGERRSIRRIHDKFEREVFNLGNKIICGKYILPENTYIETSVFWYKNGIKQLKNRGKVGDKAIIDAGGYIGDSALVLSEFFNGDIYCFEVEENNFSNIHKVLKWNGVKNVVPVNMALMDRTGVVEFYLGMKDNCDYNSIYQHGNSCFREEKVNVPCISIDDFVDKNNLEIGLIKADVEGAEKQLIQGARNTIKKQHPTLIISIYHSIDDFFTIKPLIESIYKGYNMRIFRPVLQHSFLEETLLICEAE